MAMSPEMGPSFTTHLSDEEAFWPNRDLILPMALEVQKLILEATWRAGALYEIELENTNLRVLNVGLRKSSGQVRVFVASSSDSKQDALNKLQATYETCSKVGEMDSRSEHTVPLNASSHSYIAVAASIIYFLSHTRSQTARSRSTLVRLRVEFSSKIVRTLLLLPVLVVVNGIRCLSCSLLSCRYVPSYMWQIEPRSFVTVVL